MVQVNSSSVANSINVRSSTSGSVVTAGTPSYYYVLARDWAVSPNLVENADYSSKYYANKSKEYCFTILNDAGFIAVRDDLTNIDAVAADLTNIDAVVENEININAVADDLTNIDSVAGDLTNIDNVANDLVNINAVNNNKTNIDTVAGSITKINGVYDDLTNIDNVSHYTATINTVSFYINNVNSVAGNLTNINTVATNITDVNTCSTNIANINTCAANISTIGGKVSKTGDTMTGRLVFEGHSSSIALEDHRIELEGSYNSSTGYGSSPIIDLTADTKTILRIAGEVVTQNNHKAEFFVGNVISPVMTLIYNTSTSKADIDVHNDIKNKITNWSFPSSTYYDETLPANDTVYTNTRGNGWLIFSMFAGAAGEYLQLNAFDGSLIIKNNMIAGDAAIASGYLCYAALYMAQGQQAKVYYNTTGTLLMFRFVLAKGG